MYNRYVEFIHIARCDHTFLLSDDIVDGNAHPVITRMAADPDCR